MKTTAILSLAVAAMAAPTPQAADTTAPTPFSGISSHSGSNVHLLPFTAADRQIWLNRPTSTYCPEGQVNCEGRTESTIFVGSDSLSLDVEVPGGQQVYVTPDGQLKYTGAHSASQEEGSVSTGFSQENGILLFEGQSWYACQVKDGLKVYAAAKSNGEGCTGVSWVTAGQTNFTPAWQYT